MLGQTLELGGGQDAAPCGSFQTPFFNTVLAR